MLTTVFFIWAAGLVLMLIGFMFKSSEPEKKRASPAKMVVAYIFWPVTVIAAIIQVMATSARR